jgi:hypothetical protein
MGRFASTVEFYARYREPYPPKFFERVAEQIGLCGDETLLDIGCGPGLLAIGYESKSSITLLLCQTKSRWISGRINCSLSTFKSLF